MPVLGLNPDLPLSWRRPGTYVYLNLNSPGGGGDIAHRLLILGERLASGQRPADAIYRVNSQQDVDDGSGRGSTAARAYAAAMSQVGPGALDVFVGHVAEPAGAAATYPVKITGPATASGYIKASICGYAASVAFAKDDSAATIAQALKAELDKLADAPVTFGIATDTITATYRHKGAIGEDMPMRFYVTPGKGVSVGPGSVVFANAAIGAGSVELSDGTSSVSVVLAGGETAGQVATLLAAALVAGDTPLSGVVDAQNTSQVNLSFASSDDGRDQRRVTVQVIGSTGLTVAANGGIAGASASFGTPGTGAPTLTNLLTAIAAQSGFGVWVSPWTDTTTLGTLADHIEGQANGLIQKNQRLHACAVTSLATAGAIPTGTTPTLSSSTRYAVHWQPDAAQQGYELAARTAAARAANDYPGKNWDGFLLKTNGTVPLLAPATAARADASDINSAINSYYLSPIRFDDASGRNVIELGRTTSSSSDRTLHDWSCIDQLDYQRAAIVERMTTRFGGLSYKRVGAPATPNTVEPASIEEEMYLLTREWESQDLFDGADALKPGIKATPNNSDPSRIDLVYTASVVVPIHQISVVANRGSASV